MIKDYNYNFDPVNIYKTPKISINIFDAEENVIYKAITEHEYISKDTAGVKISIENTDIALRTTYPVDDFIDFMLWFLNEHKPFLEYKPFVDVISESMVSIIEQLNIPDAKKFNGKWWKD
jgi:hypothetical protein